MTRIIFMNPHGNSRRSEHAQLLQTLCIHLQNKKKKTQFYACQTIHHSPATFERVQQTVVRIVNACIIVVEGTYSIRSAVWLDKQYQVKRN
jgi:hypothetical protein